MTEYRGYKINMDGQIFVVERDGVVVGRVTTLHMVVVLVDAIEENGGVKA